MANLYQKELDAYQTFQMEKYGYVIGDVGNTPDDELEGSAIEDAERFSEWMNASAEKGLAS